MILECIKVELWQLKIYCMVLLELLASVLDWFWLSFSLLASFDATFASGVRWLRSNTDSCSSTGTGATTGSTGIGGVWWCKWFEPIAPKLAPSDEPVPRTKCRPVSWMIYISVMELEVTTYLQRDYNINKSNLIICIPEWDDAAFNWSWFCPFW